MFHFKEEKTIKRVIKYFFSVSLILWILLSIYVLYQYVRSSSKEVTTKGGTFVEGIFNTTSYLPYLKNDRQSLFFQRFLFNSCLDYEIDNNGNINFTDDLCEVKTSDYKTYYVSLSGDHKRSDGVPLSLEDLTFTYNEIIKKNIWNIKQLNTYSDIIILNENEQMKIIFPQSSIDNTLFFTNYILPKHALIDDSLENYQQNFSIEPVYSSCGKIMPQTTDPYSLIFDLGTCKDTNLGFYQVKNLESFDKFENIMEEKKSSIVDAYVYTDQINPYITKNLLSTKIMTIFFNTKSKKTRIRLRRALGGLIRENFFDGNHMNYLKKNENEIFNYFLSKGENIKSFINRISLSEEITKEDLIDIGIKQIENSIRINGTNNRLTYYIENLSGNKQINIAIDKSYEKISLNYNTGKETSPSKYSAKDKIIQISLEKENIDKGLNKISIYGTLKGKKETILNLDIYDLREENIDQNIPEPKLVVIYFKEPNSIFVVNQLKEIFSKFDIIENFIFEGFDDPNELEGKLTVGNYDIVISNVDIGLKNNIIKLFSIDKPNINPSQYTNSKLIKLFEEYTQGNDKSKALGEINDIYAQDMPFILLGNTFTKLQIKSDIAKQLFKTGYDSIYEYNRRKRIYKNLNLTHNIKIDGERLWKIGNFIDFINTNLK
ncbi:hypothetical protein K9M48_04835 [Candidatus Gracilibacteria bacterium]|nr:hypothetical protein [Candidatus Gracilibacteria bacterium]